MDDVVLNDVNPTLDTVRRWGYDERLLLIDQDEDLVLGDVQYIPVLLELASDSRCPKGKYALDIVEEYCRFVVGHRHWHLAEPIAEFADAALSSPAGAVRDWASRFKLRLAEARSAL